MDYATLLDYSDSPKSCTESSREGFSLSNPRLLDNFRKYYESDINLLTDWSPESDIDSIPGNDLRYPTVSFPSVLPDAAERIARHVLRDDPVSSEDADTPKVPNALSEKHGAQFKHHLKCLETESLLSWDPKLDKIEAGGAKLREDLSRRGNVGVRPMYPPSDWSSFCHICSRNISRHRAAKCSNNRKAGTCRKVICKRCINQNGEDFDAIELIEDIWECFHCRQECPPNAQCYTYTRTNQRLRTQRKLEKARKNASRQEDFGGDSCSSSKRRRSKRSTTLS